LVNNWKLICVFLIDYIKSGLSGNHVEGNVDQIYHRVLLFEEGVLMLESDVGIEMGACIEMDHKLVLSVC
jgi:hypothetical protein